MGVFRHNLAKVALKRAVSARVSGVYSPTLFANARENAEFGNGPTQQIAQVNTRTDSADMTTEHIHSDVCNSVFRYPSPSGRLDNVPFKSPAFLFPFAQMHQPISARSLRVGRGAAGFGVLRLSPLKNERGVAVCGHGKSQGNNEKKGKGTCDSLKSQQCLQQLQAGFPPVATQHLNKAFWALGRGPVRPSLPAAMPKQLPSSVGLAIWRTAKRIQTNVTDVTPAALGRPV